MASPAFISTVLTLHEVARTVPLESFQERALDLACELLSFDSAAWGLGAGTEGAGSFINSIYLYRIDAAMMVDYEHARSSDFIGPAVTADLGRTHVFRARDECWSGPQYAPVIRHAIKWGMENILCTAIREPISGHVSFLSLYRSRETDRYSEAERRLKEEFMPHLSAAFLANRAWHLARAAGTLRRAPGGGALADRAGALHDCAESFRELMRLEWPRWRGNTLPPKLLGLVRPTDHARFLGEKIVCDSAALGDLFALHARRRTPVDELTPRERGISEYYSRGLTNKEIARLAGISPTTVRSHLSAVYRKLGVSHKQALAEILAAS